jgi:hypothetical protein
VTTAVTAPLYSAINSRARVRVPRAKVPEVARAA